METIAECMDTNIRINVRTRDQLRDLGKYGDSMDDIVKRLIVNWNETHRESSISDQVKKGN
jgi:hypothetical protein